MRSSNKKHIFETNYIVKNMKLFYNYPYDGEVTEERTSLFIPVPDFQILIDELNLFFDGANPLVKVLAEPSEKDPTIKLFCSSYHLLLKEPLLSNELDELGQAILSKDISFILKENNVSDTLHSWLVSVSPEEIYLSDYIAKLASPGQTIQIERYDSEYGNYNYEVQS